MKALTQQEQAQTASDLIGLQETLRIARCHIEQGDREAVLKTLDRLRWLVGETESELKRGGR